MKIIIEMVSMLLAVGAITAAIVLGSDALGGDAEAESYYPHCVGVERAEVYAVVNSIVEARNIHQFWLDRNVYGGEAWWNREWDERWVNDYNRTLSLLALTLRGCM